MVATYLKTLEEAGKEKNLLISDVRTKEEYDYLESLGFVGIKVTAPTYLRLERLMDRDGDSETQIYSRLSDDLELESFWIETPYTISTLGDTLSIQEHLSAIIERIRS